MEIHVSVDVRQGRDHIHAGLGGELKYVFLALKPVVPVGGGACQAEGEIHRRASYLKVNGGVGEAGMGTVGENKSGFYWNDIEQLPGGVHSPEFIDISAVSVLVRIL
jgi:hypothetical protein